MNSSTLILILIGVVSSFFSVFRHPKKYFEGLRKGPADEDRSEVMYLMLVVISLIFIPLYYVFHVPMDTLNILVVSAMGIVLIWKLVELFREPKTYFYGLFKKHDDPEKTSSEPLAIIIFTLVVVVSFVLKDVLEVF